MKFSLLVILICITLTNCSDTCSNNIYEQTANSSKTYKLVKFDRDCGATTGPSIQLSLIHYTDSLQNEAGNIFISNKETDTSIQGNWINDSVILIKFKKRKEIFKKDTLVDNIHIIYEEKQ